MRKVSCVRGVSVIIPTFNRASYLYSTLICLCNQKVADGVEYELVIVDSGEDDTEHIVRMFQNSTKVRIVYKKIRKCRNRSLVRNTGAGLARHSILCFLDNDMLTPPDFIQRHYDEHQKQNHLVVMGCRRSLTEFDISALGEDTLRNNFGILEKLPWYADERLEMYEDRDQWRFVFSHTLSMETEDFYNAGQFNVKFGEHWGFEDLELGFNLMQNGCSFLLIKDSFTYHQPHFLQSKQEQCEIQNNRNLFLKIHNSYEVEVYFSFYADFGKYTSSIKKTLKISQNNKPTKIEKQLFDKILCFIHSAEDSNIDSRFQLGVCIPAVNKSYRRTLILETFFILDKLLQVSILSEAIRTSKTVCFRLLSEQNRFILNEVSRYGGFSIIFEDKDTYTYIYKQQSTNSCFFDIRLPDAYTPEKRYVYSYLCKLLSQKGCSLILSDFQNNKTFFNDDLRLCDNDVLNLQSYFLNSIGNVNVQTIFPFSIFHMDSSCTIQNFKSSFIIHDNEFFQKNEELQYRVMEKSRHLSEENFADLTFLSVFDSLLLYKCNEEEDTSDDIICFMESGFYEDGIDLILRAFCQFHNNHPSVKLTIKIPFLS